MKKVSKLGSFIDFAGEERQVTFAAVSQELDLVISVKLGNVAIGQDNLLKEVRIGVAVQSPKDLGKDPNPELSKIIAEGKALKEKSCIGKLYSTEKGFINGTVVQVLLDQELAFFKQNPGKYIKGYNKDKALYESDPDAYLDKMFDN